MELGHKTAALYQALRHAIVSGTLTEGMRLPSSRELAKLYGISRGSVNQAYDMLLAEGYVRTERGLGTFVAVELTGADRNAEAGGRGDDEPERRQSSAERSGTDQPFTRARGLGMDVPAGKNEAYESRQYGTASEAGFAKADHTAESRPFVQWQGPASASTVPAHGRPAAERLKLSAWGSRLPEAAPEQYKEAEIGGFDDPVDFTIGNSDPNQLPLGEWRSMLYGEVRAMTDGLPFSSVPVEGHLPLREAIAKELRRERGIRADASRLFITSGSMQAIALLQMLLLEPGDRLVLENPCYMGTFRAAQAAGAKVVPAMVDDRGIVPDNWPAELLIVTPTRHFPTGAVLPVERRIELLDWASRRNAVIVEDDYDSELRWGGRPVEPLKALDREDRVVYVGTYSKTMYSQLRIGYAVLPESLAGPFKRAKALLEPQPPGVPEQRALSRFMASGGYARHIRRMRRSCGRRLLRFEEEAAARLTRWFRFVPSGAGLHLCAVWRGSAEAYAELRTACAAEYGVRWSDGARFWIGKPPCETALFGFAHLPEERIAAGVKRIEAAARVLFGAE
nr:PLP-dependent aminotransferase family protein [Paenibacillus humicola]